VQQSRRVDQILASTATQTGAEIPFDNILDRITGSDPSVTDYLLSEADKYPFCRRSKRVWLNLSDRRQEDVPDGFAFLTLKSGAPQGAYGFDPRPGHH